MLSVFVLDLLKGGHISLRSLHPSELTTRGEMSRTGEKARKMLGKKEMQEKLASLTCAYSV